jgi:hypothetical protein
VLGSVVTRPTIEPVPARRPVACPAHPENYDTTTGTSERCNSAVRAPGTAFHRSRRQAASTPNR